MFNICLVLESFFVSLFLQLLGDCITKVKSSTIRGLSFEGPERNQIKKEDMAELCQGQDKLDFVVFIS